MGAFLGRWECGSLLHGQLKFQRLPLFPGVVPVCQREQSCSSGVPGQALAQGGVSQGRSPGLVPVCPSVPPCRACSAPAQGENGPKPCGFLVGVNTGSSSFHGTFHWCLSVVQSLSNSLSSCQSCVPHRGWAEQLLFHVWPDKSYREWCNFTPCCLNPSPTISIPAFPLQMHQLWVLMHFGLLV